MSPITFAPIATAPARLRRVVVGLRPFRPDGYRVGAEQFGEKLLVHNYGHGGSGVTLSWGTARAAAALVPGDGRGPVAVVGCGVIGLSTARVLQQHGMDVTIHAATLPPETTSNVPAAFWMPVGTCDPARITAEFARLLAEALRESRRAFEHLAAEARYGIRELPQLYVDAEPPELSPFMAVAPELFAGPRLSPGDHPFGERHAILMGGMVIDTTRYIGALYDDFLAAGGTVVTHEVRDRAAIGALPERVVVNCAGLGAGPLANDTTMIPVKGQLLLLEPQPEVEYIVVAPRDALYMVPRGDAIVLGTSKEPGITTLAANAAETARMLGGLRALWGEDAVSARRR